MNVFMILPIIIPLLTAAIAFLFWNSHRLQRIAGLLGSSAHLIASLALFNVVLENGIQVVPVGNWPPPFDITLVADLFSAIMVVMAGVMGFSVAIYSLGSMDIGRERFGYYPLLQILIMGVSGAFLTGDIFNLYVWFEVMLIASFVLLSLGGERPQLEGAIKYVTLNLLSSALFLAAVGLLYGIVGTLNMADLAVKIPSISEPGLILALSMLFLVAFGIKGAVFPLFFWLPASYHTPPVAVSAVFSGLLTKVGVYSLIRVFTLLFIQDVSFTHGLILVVAGFTMVTGVLGAVAQYEVRRLLSFHIISQIGYLLMGLGLYTISSLAAAIYFMVHVILAKSTLFLISGIAHHLLGTYDLKKLGGLYRTAPVLSVLFLIPALSLAGIPPLSGFFAKLGLIQAGLELGHYIIVAVALGVSILTLFSMIKIWAEAFWKPLPVMSLPVESDGESARPRSPMILVMPVAALAFLTVILGLAAEPFFELSMRAAEQLMDPTIYVRAVLGG
jgi:multicomponent Na+:H+ antiporter subunit D